MILPLMEDDEMARIVGGRFRMGCTLGYPEEGPVRTVEVGEFWMDRHAVTNRAFACFVAATGHVTLAERRLDAAAYPGAPVAMLQPGSLVFCPPPGSVRLDDPAAWWRRVPGADWRHPEGPESGIDGREDEPVVQVAHADANAYAAWAGKRLPSEAEWEFAARGGLDGAIYCWGDEPNPGGRWMANSWQGDFPLADRGEDGFAGRAPVGSFPPNGYGLFDMAGNVWEWTSEAWSPRHGTPRRCCASEGRPGLIARKVIKGGSYLCAPSYCLRYRPAARQPQSVDSATCHIGFRCVRD